jgi:hypothetical protein
MRLYIKIFFVTTVSLFSLQLLAQQEDVIQTQSSKQKPDYCYDSWVLFDPDIPLVKKVKDIKGLEISAESGNSLSQYLIGSLYRLGEKHPAKLFSEDNVKAKKYLSNAAIQGSFQAMAAMAELELANKNYKDAILWAQIYAYYSKEEQEKKKGKSSMAYQAFLLKRILDTGRENKVDYLDKVFLQDFNSFFAKYDAKIQANKTRIFSNEEIEKYKACDSVNESSALDKIVLLNANKGYANAQVSYVPGGPSLTYYLLGINGDGEVTKALVVDALPSEIYAKRLIGVAQSLEFNKAPGLKLRQAFIPLTSSDSRFRIKTKNSNSTSHR